MGRSLDAMAAFSALTFLGVTKSKLEGPDPHKLWSSSLGFLHNDNRRGVSVHSPRLGTVPAAFVISQDVKVIVADICSCLNGSIQLNISESDDRS